MLALKINIQSKEDIGSGIPVVHGLTRENATESEDVTVAILEDATESGQTVLLFAAKDKRYDLFSYFQITAKLFEGLCGVYKGAQERFGQVMDFKLNTNQDCQDKLLKAGFTLFRFDANRLLINYCSTPGAWKLHSKGYASKAELERKRKELMADPKSLEG